MTVALSGDLRTLIYLGVYIFAGDPRVGYWLGPTAGTKALKKDLTNVFLLPECLWKVSLFQYTPILIQ